MRLTLQDRKEIAKLYRKGYSAPRIARVIGVHHSTIYDELRRGDVGINDPDGRPVYDAQVAQLTLQRNISRKRQAAGGR